MERPLVIANPAAGSGRTQGQLPDLMAELTARIGAVDIETTTRRGHAEELAAQAVADGRELVIGVGGDGALNEVVNGLLTARHGDAAPPLPPWELPRLGIVATGTGGDFGRSLGIPPARDAYLEAIAGDRARLIDVGLARFAPRRRDEAAGIRRFTTVSHRMRRPGDDARPAAAPLHTPQRSGLLTQRYFLNVLSAGVGGLVDRYTAALPAAMGGRLAYGLAAVTAVFTCPRRRLTLRATLPDGSTSVRAFDGYALAIGNGHTFGGGMRVAPDALPDDGLLEVVTFETPAKVTMLRHFFSLYAGRHLTKPGVGHFPCLRLELADTDAAAAADPFGGVPAGHQVAPAAHQGPPAGDLFPLDVDGDNLGDLPLSVEVVPAALRILA